MEVRRQDAFTEQLPADAGSARASPFKELYLTLTLSVNGEGTGEVARCFSIRSDLIRRYTP
jgi:hypothetical protein